MSENGFWDDAEAAQAVVGRLSVLKSIVEPAEDILRRVKDLAELFELAEAESDTEMLSTLEKDLAELKKRCDRIELAGLLSRPEDSKNCYFSIHAETEIPFALVSVL